MAVLSALIDPKVLPTLSAADIDMLTAVVDAEIIRNPDIQKILGKRLDQFEVGRRPTK
jgi:hypothetical protein